MEITFSCTKCGQHIAVDAAGAGIAVNCPKCGASIEVPYKSKPLDKPASPPSFKLPEPQPSRFPPLVVVLGVLCAGLLVLVLILTRSRTLSPGSATSQKLHAIIQPNITLDGAVFIVTKSGQNIKLGLVQIDVIPLDVLTSHLKERKAYASNEVARLEHLFEVAKDNCQAGSDKYEAQKTGNESSLEIKQLQWKVGWTQAVDELGKITVEITRYSSPYFCLEHLPSPSKRTKTDADGKFQMKVPGSGAYAIYASASRSVGDKVEKYYWLLQVDTHGESPRKIMLSNDNLLEGEPGVVLDKL